ncbi:MAG: hypothetical protein H8D23_27220 [Candidatus Brocadiales bacterium]|nr:hypothetical protein [Candidatus Brocadiales bacterium]
MDSFSSIFSNGELDEVWITVDCDPLAESCYRHIVGLQQCIDLADHEIKTVQDVTSEAAILAKTIRSHFGQKLLMDSLDGNQQTTVFRRELLQYLTETTIRPNNTKAKYAGMIRSLPRLYAEDITIEEFKEKYNNTPFTETTSSEKETVTLQFVKKEQKPGPTVSQKMNVKSKVNVYWLIDNDERLYLLDEYQSSPFIKVFEKMLEKPISLTGYRQQNLRRKDGLNYYTLTTWEVD